MLGAFARGTSTGGTFVCVLTFSGLAFYALELGVTRVVLMQGGSLAIFVVAP
jgi:hypothetical protein